MSTGTVPPPCTGRSARPRACGRPRGAGCRCAGVVRASAASALCVEPLSACVPPPDALRATHILLPTAHNMNIIKSVHGIIDKGYKYCWWNALFCLMQNIAMIDWFCLITLKFMNRFICCCCAWVLDWVNIKILKTILQEWKRYKKFYLLYEFQNI